MTTEISDTLRTTLESAAAAAGVELVHVEFRGGILRLVIDRGEDAEEGITVDDCAAVSRAASDLLDDADFGGKRYTLEVTSPGIDRPMYRATDYQRFAGRRARVTYFDGERRKATVVGRLGGLTTASEPVGPEEAEVLLELDGEAAPLRIPLRDIKTARLEIEI